MTALGAPPRQRLIAAMAASIEQRGYRDTTVAEVVRVARTSRRTFYEQFADREACFLALFEQTTGETIARIAAAASPEQPWEAQVALAIDAYIEGVTARPALQQSFVRELPGLAREGAERQRQVIERFARTLVDLVESGRRVQPEVTVGPLPMDVAIIIVSGLRELLVVAIPAGRDLRELRDSARQVVKAIIAAVVL